MSESNNDEFLELICAGFGRTGTKTLQTTLDEIGYKAYHGDELFRNPNNSHHFDKWVRLRAKLGKHENIEKRGVCGTV